MNLKAEFIYKNKSVEIFIESSHNFDNFKLLVRKSFDEHLKRTQSYERKSNSILFWYTKSVKHF